MTGTFSGQIAAISSLIAGTCDGSPFQRHVQWLPSMTSATNFHRGGMLHQISKHIRECHARALEARRRGTETSDPDQKADLERSEQDWLRLADSYALSERLERYLLVQDSKRERRGQWLPAVRAPFDCNLEIAVIKSATPHAVAFPCRRILGGWMDADSRERLDVQPTHWREWR